MYHMLRFSDFVWRGEFEFCSSVNLVPIFNRQQFSGNHEEFKLDLSGCFRINAYIIAICSYSLVLKYVFQSGNHKTKALVDP